MIKWFKPSKKGNKYSEKYTSSVNGIVNDIGFALSIFKSETTEG